MKKDYDMRTRKLFTLFLMTLHSLSVFSAGEERVEEDHGDEVHWDDDFVPPQPQLVRQRAFRGLLNFLGGLNQLVNNMRDPRLGEEIRAEGHHRGLEEEEREELDQLDNVIVQQDEGEETPERAT